tara:strand:- start:621 stop:2006 length:1386 start_codon:yes stop_codon:yes gene_type:complete
MIRLKDILLEYSDTHKKTTNVLTIVDDAALKKFGFARQLYSQGVIIGEIESAHEQSSEELKDIIISNASPELDLIVVFCRGIYDDDPTDVFRNFSIISQFCKTIDVPVAFFAIPTLRFIKDTSKITNNWTEIERKKINNRLRQQISSNNFFVDISRFDLDEYFAKDGIHFNLQGHFSVYDKLFDIIRQVDPYASVKRDIAKFKFNIRDVQIKLKYLGYEINIDEIRKQYIGDTTLEAAQDVARKLGYEVKDTISNSLARAILTLTPERSAEIHDHEIFIKSCTDPKHPNARLNYNPNDYTGTNGIANSLPLVTKNGVTLTKPALAQYVKMLNTMKDNDIPMPTTVASFRSYQTQYDIVDWDLYECEGIWKTKHKVMGNIADVAEPGTSDHGEGLAIDIDANIGGDTQKWIRDNGEAFGWVADVASESWHFAFYLDRVDTEAQEELESGILKTINPLLLNKI